MQFIYTRMHVFSVTVAFQLITVADTINASIGEQGKKPKCTVTLFAFSGSGGAWKEKELIHGQAVTQW